MPQPPHPLLNHIIILRVLNHVNLKELKIIRLVCKEWHFHATAILPFKCCVKIRRNIQAKRFISEHESGNSRTLQSPDVRNVVFDSCLFYAVMYDQMLTFFKRISKSARELTFSNCAFESKEAIHLILDCFPYVDTCAFGSQNKMNVHFLDLEVLSERPALEPRRYASVKTLEITVGVNQLKIGTWEEILEWFPSISVLIAQCRCSEDLGALLHAISKAKENSAFRLSEFSSFLTEFSDSQLRKLAAFEFQYRSLEVSVFTSVSRSTLQRLFQTCQDSIETLSLYHNWNVGVPSDFPYELTLTHLTALEIPGDMIKSLDFLISTPSLTKLVIGEHDDEGPILWDIVQREGKQLNHLKLTSFRIMYRLLPECIRLVAEMIPNIQYFASYLDDDSIRSLFKNMRNLEELMVFGTELTDEGITGISLAVLLDQNILNKQLHREFSYIGNCKKLRIFGITPVPQENISDYSVHFGFMETEELNSLDLPETSITNDGIKYMRRKSNLIKLSAKFFVGDDAYFLRPIELQEI